MDAVPTHKPTADYSTVTETWGLTASPEQVAMQNCRYRIAGKLAAGGRVLEIGCGAGLGLSHLRRQAATAIGGDYTMKLLREAKDHTLGVPLVRMDAETLPFRNGAFDVVLMLEMIYYLPHLKLGLAEAHRVLRPGGLLFVCLPNRDRPDFNPSPFAHGYPNVPELARLLNETGFEPSIMAAFPVDSDDPRDRVLGAFRHLAVRFRLIPRSMRMKALLKRVLYRRGPSLGEVREDAGQLVRPLPIDASRPTSRYKTLYATAVKS